MFSFPLLVDSFYVLGCCFCGELWNSCIAFKGRLMDCRRVRIRFVIANEVVLFSPA